MKLLIIGGTRFVGRAIAEAALAAGHELTLFHRGRTNPDLFPEAEHILADRNGGLEVLKGRQWTAVIDTSGYLPRFVEDSARILNLAVEHYTFISTISVYDAPQAGTDENAALGVLADPMIEEITGETYGPLKVLCEKAVTRIMGANRALIVRPGLIVGPHDATDRFSYWPHRLARGGKVLAPGTPDVPVQFVDVRDLAEWTLRATEAKLTGAYNVTGPAEPLTMGQFLSQSQEALASTCEFVWADEAFLLAEQVAPFTEMPLWVPAEAQGFSQVSIQKALAQGLTFRPLADTVRDTLAWLAERPSDEAWRAGLSPEREKALLEKLIVSSE